ncbi:MAG: response regulator, partial [Phycisphaerae bacterium]|nr:response regulator [Phycisphaerae bacterium]
MAAEKPPRVLIVEDEPDMNKLLAEVLSAYGFAPISAGTGEEALEYIAKHRPDAILLDLMLPGLSGYELCRRLKTSRDTNPIPVLILTALDRASDRRLGYETGADDYMTKPFSPEGLISRLQACLDRRLTGEAKAPLEMVLEPGTSLAALRGVNLLATALYCRTTLATEAIEALRAGLARLTDAAAKWADRHHGQPPAQVLVHLDGRLLVLEWRPGAEGAEAFLAEHLGEGSETVASWFASGAVDRRSAAGGGVRFEKDL